MKYYYLHIISFLLLLSFSLQAQYNRSEISLLSAWNNNPTESNYNSVWGWIDSTDNKQYAILGSGSGTYFVDITTPETPVLADFVAGPRSDCTWREYKTFGNYLYMVSDDDVPNSLQIMDLSYLPDSVHLVYNDSTLISRAHTLYIDGDKLYCGSVKTPFPVLFYTMAVYSLANPELPVLLRTLDQDVSGIDQVHDMFVRNDTIYASCGYDGLYFLKYNAGANTFSAINSLLSYPRNGYNHSSTLTPDGKHLFFADEVPAKLPLKILDISNLGDISFLDTFKSNNGATPHNPFMYSDNRLVVSYYQDGLQIFDVSNPAAPIRSGYFDTDTLRGLNDGFAGSPYHGCWGAYVGLPNGIVLASDMQNGLYVLDARYALGLLKHPPDNNAVSVYPNPFVNTLNISLQLKNHTKLVFEIYDVAGRKISSEIKTVPSGNTVKSIDTNNLRSGAYLIKITGNSIDFSQKIVKK